MKRRRLKKTMAVAMAVVMLFSMTGCGTNGEKKSKDEKSGGTQDVKEMVFQGEDFQLEGYQGDIVSMYVKGDKLYFNTYEGTEDTASEAEGENADEEYEVKGTTINRLYAADIEGGKVTEIPLSFPGENEKIDSVTAGNDDMIAFLSSVYDEKTRKAAYTLVKIDGKGNELFRTDITKELKLAQDEYVSKIVMDDKGRLMVIMGQKVYILDENGKSIGEVKADNNLEGVAITKDGEVVFASNVSSKGSQYAQVQVLDVEKRKWRDAFKLDLKSFSTSDVIMNGIDYDFYYKDDSGIYGYDIADGTSDKLIDYAASGITSEDSWRIIPIAKDKLIGLSYGETGTNFIYYSKTDPAAIEDKTTITYSAVFIDSAVEEAMIEFNKTSKEYQIEFKDYSEEEDPYTKMTVDILAGNIPDIIDLRGVPFDQCIEMGMLEDLTPYYEKDPELSTDDILDSVLEAMKVDGKIYYVAPDFNVMTLVARTADVGDGTGWTFDELKTLMEKKGEDIKIFWDDNKLAMLSIFLENGLFDFVDWKTGECSFDNQDFKDILEICNSRGTDEEFDYVNAPSELTLIQEGKMLLAEGAGISPEEIVVFEKLFGEDITCIGYPNKKKEGSFFELVTQLGIYSKSEVKDGAWEFIRTFMTKEYQRQVLYTSSSPTRKDCFDMMIKSKTATEAYTDEFGQEFLPLGASFPFWRRGELEIEARPLTDEEVDMYINLVNNTKKRYNYDSAMMEIIAEEANVYFAGEKSLDETADIIQNRIKTYVNENR